MLMLLVLNYCGITLGARTQNLLSVAQRLLLGLAVFALTLAPRHLPWPRPDGRAGLPMLRSPGAA